MVEMAPFHRDDLAPLGSVPFLDRRHARAASADVNIERHDELKIARPNVHSSAFNFVFRNLGNETRQVRWHVGDSSNSEQSENWRASTPLINISDATESAGLTA